MPSSTLIALNGDLIPDSEAQLSVRDRSFLYGDAVFTTLTLVGGRPILLPQHLNRLRTSAHTLRIPLPQTDDQIRRDLLAVAKANGLRNAIVRIHLSRGDGPRGLSLPKLTTPLLLITSHSPPSRKQTDGPEPWQLVVSSNRVFSGDPWIRHKTANRLLYIMAKAEADERAVDDALLCNQLGHATESTTGNLFWIQQGQLHTPPISAGLLPGITRQWVLDWAAAHQQSVHETSLPPDQLRNTDGVFLTMSTLGICEAIHLDGIPLPRSRLTTELHQAYQNFTLAPPPPQPHT